jgi:hypothetical protein
MLIKCTSDNHKIFFIADVNGEIEAFVRIGKSVHTVDNTLQLCHGLTPIIFLHFIIIVIRLDENEVLENTSISGPT